LGYYVYICSQPNYESYWVEASLYPHRASDLGESIRRQDFMTDEGRVSVAGILERLAGDDIKEVTWHVTPLVNGAAQISWIRGEDGWPWEWIDDTVLSPETFVRWFGGSPKGVEA
jgi:hypothetical protein